MSELVLVRHGQASFGSDNYDRLSEQGHRQVRILAEYWHSLGERFDHLYSGELRRQKETAAALEPVTTAGGSQVHPGFNEYEGDPLISIYLRDHARADGFDELLEPPYMRDRKQFQKVLEAATARWLADELEPRGDEAGFERWREFTGRVQVALDELMERHRGGKRILVATSGGVIAAAMQHVLSLPDHKTIATNWVVNNASVTRILYGAGRVSLHQFNGLAHLETPQHKSLITLR